MPPSFFCGGEIKVDAKICIDNFLSDLSIRMHCLGWCYIITPVVRTWIFCMVVGSRFELEPQIVLATLKIFSRKSCPRGPWQEQLPRRPMP